MAELLNLPAGVDLLTPDTAAQLSGGFFPLLVFGDVFTKAGILLIAAVGGGVAYSLSHDSGGGGW